MLKNLGLVCGLSLVLGSTAFAEKGSGHGTGNGGGAWDCGPKQNVELVDLFEAAYPEEIVDGSLTIKRSHVPYEVQILERLEKLRPDYPLFVEKVLRTLRSIESGKVVDAIPGSLAPPTDVNNEIMKPGCTLVGVAIYNDQLQRLRLDRSLLKRMSQTDQAALWLHEAIYKVFREGGATDSRLARYVVAAIFAEEPLETFGFSRESDVPLLKRLFLAKGDMGVDYLATPMGFYDRVEVELLEVPAERKYSFTCPKAGKLTYSVGGEAGTQASDLHLEVGKPQVISLTQAGAEQYLSSLYLEVDGSSPVDTTCGHLWVQRPNCSYQLRLRFIGALSSEHVLTPETTRDYSVSLGECALHETVKKELSVNYWGKVNIAPWYEVFNLIFKGRF